MGRVSCNVKAEQEKMFAMSFVPYGVCVLQHCGAFGYSEMIVFRPLRGVRVATAPENVL